MGCASRQERGQPDPQFERLERQTRQIDEHEAFCIEEVTAETNALVGRSLDTVTPYGALEMQNLIGEQNREVLKCEARADRQRSLLGAAELNEYRQRAEQQRDHTDLVMILTASPR